MFVVQTGRAARTRKYSIFMFWVLLLSSAIAPLLTLHWDVRPPKK
jgi:hypothetical protein